MCASCHKELAASQAETAMAKTCHFAEREDDSDLVKLSYRAISRYSGIKSRNAIAKAIQELEDLHWLIRIRPRSESVIRETNLYRVTPGSDELRELANAIARQHSEEIQAEQDVRAQQRAERRRTLSQSQAINPAERCY